MNNSLLNIIKYKIKYGVIVEWYNLCYLILRKKHIFIPKIASIDETISTIINNKSSVSRYGDGEILLINPNKNIGFQNGSHELSLRLIEVLNSNEQNHIICLSDTFSELNRYNRKARRFWRTHFYLYEDLWYRNISINKQYYNTFISRPYMDFASKNETETWFTAIKNIWKDRNIIFVEGEKSKLGIGNDLFNNSKSISRIICPSKDAFNVYDSILSECSKQNIDSLYLIALGPTATILSYDLYKSGRQAIDIGHIDVEYEWWKMRSKRKVALKNKYVNESPNGEDIDNNEDETYKKQIIAKV